MKIRPKSPLESIYYYISINFIFSSEYTSLPLYVTHITWTPHEGEIHREKLLR